MQSKVGVYKALYRLSFIVYCFLGYDGSIAAVSILEAGDTSVKGVVRFVQATPDVCVIDGTVDGLRPGNYQLSIHECGDLSNGKMHTTHFVTKLQLMEILGCTSVGNVFNPTHNDQRLYGQLGQIVAERNGRAEFRMEDNVLKLSDVIGRSFVVATLVSTYRNNITDLHFFNRFYI